MAAFVVAFVLTGCGSSATKSPEETGVRTRSIEELRDYGLTAKQAVCVTDKLGAQTVVEATDLTALTEGQAYRDAADACIS